MSALGKRIRLNRIFSHPSGRILSVAVDHMINYPVGLPKGLRAMTDTLAAIVEGRPDALTMNKGIAMRYMAPHAGQVPLIIQSMAPRADADAFADHCTAEEAVALGADAIAVAMFVHGPTELEYIRHLADVVREAETLGLPVIPHIYPLSSDDEKHAVVHDAESIFYAVRVGVEMGADVVKVPYTGDVASFADIVRSSPVPVVTAGGPKAETLDDAVAMMAAIRESGAAGATVGRNVWGFDGMAGAVRALKTAMCG